MNRCLNCGEEIVISDQWDNVTFCSDSCYLDQLDAIAAVVVDDSIMIRSKSLSLQDRATVREALAMLGYCYPEERS